MIIIKDMNERWLNEVKDYIIDSTIRENNIEDWDFLTSQVDNLEGYLSDRKDALVFDVKGMGYADYDEINKAFKKLGHDNLDAQDFSEDIYEICQFDNETIFHDIENYLEVPFYAMGRMGGHWGVLCEDVCDKDLVDVEINEKELWKYIEKNYDLNDYDDIWDIDCEDVGRYADENCFNFVADKDFVKHLNNAWDEIKKQSDYMLTYDYAEYIVEKLIEDNFLESKKSTRKSIKESSVRVVTFQQIVDSRFDDISKGEKILDDRKNEIVELCGNDFSVYTTDRHFVEFDDDTQWRETYYVKKNNNNVTWDDLYKIVNSVKPCRYKFDKINDSHFESKKSVRKDIFKESLMESKDDLIQVTEDNPVFPYWVYDTHRKVLKDIFDMCFYKKKFDIFVTSIGGGDKEEIYIVNDDMAVILTKETANIIIHKINEDNKYLADLSYASSYKTSSEIDEYVDKRWYSEFLKDFLNVVYKY